MKYYRILNTIVSDKDKIVESDDIEALDKVCLELNSLVDKLEQDESGSKTRFALRSAMEGFRYFVIYVDVDNLKSINDQMGHAYGTNYLKEVVGTLKKYGNVYRVGGDEFVLLTDKTNSLKFSSKFVDSDKFSFGVVNSDEYVDYKDALELADKRMYEHKKSKVKNILG